MEKEKLINFEITINEIPHKILFVEHITDYISYEDLSKLQNTEFIEEDDEIFYEGIYDQLQNTIVIVVKDKIGRCIPAININITLWHEIVHAILLTSGFTDEGLDEKLVQILALGINEVVSKINSKANEYN